MGDRAQRRADIKPIITAVALLTLATPAMAQEHPTIPGNYKKLAACVYRAMDVFLPGSWRLTDLVDDIELSSVIPIRGVPVRTVKANFRKVTDDITALDVEDEAKLPAFYPVRSIATKCASR